MIRTNISREIYWESDIFAAWSCAGGKLDTADDISNFRNWLLDIDIRGYDVDLLIRDYITKCKHNDLKDNAKEFLANISK